MSPAAVSRVTGALSLSVVVLPQGVLFPSSLVRRCFFTGYLFRGATWWKSVPSDSVDRAARVSVCVCASAGSEDKAQARHAHPTCLRTFFCQKKEISKAVSRSHWLVHWPRAADGVNRPKNGRKAAACGSDFCPLISCPFLLWCFSRADRARRHVCFFFFPHPLPRPITNGIALFLGAHYCGVRKTKTQKRTKRTKKRGHGFIPLVFGKRSSRSSDQETDTQHVRKRKRSKTDTERPPLGVPSDGVSCGGDCCGGGDGVANRGPHGVARP